MKTQIKLTMAVLAACFRFSAFAADALLLTGLAGLLAGACSMALGEWLSVQNARELYEQQIATERDVASRKARILGGRDWVRLGAVEMGLDCLRRYLQGLPVYERIDFEKT